MTSRMQITMDADLRRRAVKQAEKLGVSFAEYVRRAIAKDLGPAPERPPISAIFDLGRSDEKTSIARDKDRMIAEAIEAGHRRK